MANTVKLDLYRFSSRIQDLMNDKVVDLLLTLAAEAAVDDIKTALVDALYRTRLFQGLISHSSFEEDVAAHLGFEPAFQSLVMREMVEAIRGATDLGVMNVKNNQVIYNLIIEAKTLEENMSSITDNNYISYSSEYQATTIPWMEWLIAGMGGDRIKASIYYNAGGIRRPGGYLPSRSGRAVMLKTDDSSAASEDTPEGTTLDVQAQSGWSIDDYNKFALGTNFVEDLLNDEKLHNRIARIIYQKINNVSRKKVFKVGYGGTDDVAPF